MILPIVAYGDVVLRIKAIEISKEYPKLEALIENIQIVTDSINARNQNAAHINIYH